MVYAGGWKFLTNDQKIQIFISEIPDAIPLETEASIKVDVIHQSFPRQWLPIYLLMVLNGFIRVLDSRIDITDALIILAGAAFIWDLCCYFIWYFKARQAAAEGWYYETKTPFVRMYLETLILLAMILLLSKNLGIKTALFFVAIGAIAFMMND